ncbi:hypothetical protein KSP40_PGU013927 [Platanthera guangdongensis]|uniref:Uncharacterized protein n=1 Tax=Platanthera guangdongensis TaxID=2320717 RepID=A0ABR2LN71_9ASPA
MYSATSLKHEPSALALHRRKRVSFSRTTSICNSPIADTNDLISPARHVAQPSTSILQQGCMLRPFPSGPATFILYRQHMRHRFPFRAHIATNFFHFRALLPLISIVLSLHRARIQQNLSEPSAPLVLAKHMWKSAQASAPFRAPLHHPPSPRRKKARQDPIFELLKTNLSGF